MMVWGRVGDYYKEKPISKSHVEMSFYICQKIVWKNGAHSIVYAIWLVHIRTVPWLIPLHYLTACTPLVILMVMEIFSLHFSAYLLFPHYKILLFSFLKIHHCIVFSFLLHYIYTYSSFHCERNYKHEGSLCNFPHFGYCPQLLSPPNHNGWFK